MSTRKHPPVASATPWLLFALLAALAPGDAAAQGIGPVRTPSTPLDPAVLAPLFEVQELSIQDLEFLSVGGPGSADIVVEVAVDAGTWTLSLEPYSLRSDLFEVLVDDGSGALVPHPAPPVLTRRGTVLEVPGSHVRASLDGDRLEALILTDVGNWVVQPVSAVGVAATGSWHVVYDATDTIPGGYTCGTPDPQGVGAPASGSAPFGTTFTLAEIAADADFEFYQLNGSSVTSTVNDVEAVLNGVEGVYDNAPILIAYEITTIVVRTTSADPYGTQSNPGALLDSFDNVWSASPESAIHRDVAHLFTGVNLNGSVIGIANLSDVCTASSYGLAQSRFSSNFNNRVALSAHELGHNWSATHCDAAGDCRIMCSVLGGCDGLSPLSFASGPAGQISAYRDTRTCLSTQPPAVPMPFLEEFATSTLDENLWLHNNGGAISTQGVAEPSAPNSFVLDATGAGLYSDDELRSNRVLLGGSIDPNLGVFVEHRGVEAGEELIIEYLTSGLDWVELDTIVSDGTLQSSYVQYSYDLPANARHNNFRVRFRTEVDEANDDWYIDDITIDEGPPPPLDPPSLFAITPSTGPAAGGTFVMVVGDDFTPDIVVLVGNQPLVDQLFLGPNEVRGYTPEVAFPGGASVIVSQASGSDFLSPGFTFTQEDLHHGSGLGSPGGTVDVPIIGDHETVLSGYSVAVDFNPAQVQIDLVTMTGSDALGAAFFQPIYNNSAGGGWWTLGVVLSFFGTFTLPPSPDTILAIARYDIPAGAALGSQISIAPVTGVGVPPTENLFVDPNGTGIRPKLFGGTITVSGQLFIRGDANLDLVVNIGDAVAILAYLFSSGPAGCIDAVDSNDDGLANIADAIALLDYLFSGGAAPPAPFPNSGTDPTSDPLDCAQGAP